MAEVLCGDCSLHIGGKCRITGATTADADECSLTHGQRKSLLVQTKRICTAGRGREVVIDSLSACDGGEHITATGTVDGAPVEKRFGFSEFEDAYTEDPLDALLPLMVEVVRMAGATTSAEARAALLGTVYVIGGG